jgi:hypothetical protein
LLGKKVYISIYLVYFFQISFFLLLNSLHFRQGEAHTDRKIAEIAETRKQFAERGRLLEKCREHLRESQNRKESKDEAREIMSAKKLLEKEGFLVKRMREETDIEDNADEYGNEDDNEYNNWRI